jgi:hypothetical protein
MNGLAILKEISIVATGIFGIVGLLTEFRDKKTKEITGWGYCALFGVIFSTVIAASIQFKESKEQEKEVRRSLDPIDYQWKVEETYIVDCKKSAKLCADLRAEYSHGSVSDFTAGPFGTVLELTKSIRPDGDLSAGMKGWDCDSVLYLTPLGKQVDVTEWPDSNLLVMIKDTVPEVKYTDGVINSIIDLDSARVRIRKMSGDPFTITQAVITTKNGEHFESRDLKVESGAADTYDGTLHRN